MGREKLEERRVSRQSQQGEDEESRGGGGERALGKRGELRAPTHWCWREGLGIVEREGDSPAAVLPGVGPSPRTLCALLSAPKKLTRRCME